MINRDSIINLLVHLFAPLHVAFGKKKGKQEIHLRTKDLRSILLNAARYGKENPAIYIS